MIKTIPTGQAILLTLYKIQYRYKSSYSFVTRNKLRKLLIKYYKINRCLSTISYHLKQYRKAGIIIVREQYGSYPDGTHFNIASNRWFGAKGIKYLISLGVVVWNKLKDWAFKGIKFERRKNIKHTNKYYNITQRPPRRAAGPPERLETALSNTLNSLK